MTFFPSKARNSTSKRECRNSVQFIPKLKLGEFLNTVINKNSFKLLLVWVIILGILYSILAILRHNHFQSGGFDLGIYDQAVWKYSKFTNLFNTIIENHTLGDHLTLTLPLLAPLFWIWDDVRILLIFQAFWLSFSSLAVFKLCQHRKLPPFACLSLSIIYSLFFGIQFAAFFDFHPVALGAGLIAWLVYFFESRKKYLFLLTLSLFLLTQENMGIALFCLGLIYVFKKQHRLYALAFLITGFAWSIIAVKIIGSFSNAGFYYQPEFPPNLKLAIFSFFDSQEKRLVWWYSFGWFSFLPILSLGSVLAVLTDLSQYFVTSQRYPHMMGPFLHHRVILAIFLLLGTLETIKFLEKRSIKPQVVAAIILIVSLGQQYFFHFPLNKLSKPIYWKTESWMTDNEQLFKSIPPDASIATQQNLLSHLSHRQEIYLAWPRKSIFPEPICGQNACWWLDFVGKPEFLMVDLHPNQWLTQLLESNENFQAAVRNMELAGKVTLEKEINYAKLYRVSY